MTDLKYNAILQKIMEYAKSFDRKNGAVITAEQYLVSVIEVVTGNADIEITEEERNKIISVLKGKLAPGDVGFEKARKRLIDHINGNNSSSFMEGLFIQRCSYKAMVIAESRGQKELSPDILLECILNEPTDFIKNNIVEHEKAVNPPKNTFTDPKMSWENKPAVPGYDENPCPESAEEKKKETANPPDQQITDPKKFVEDLTERVREIRDKLSAAVFGQENAISVFTSGYFQSELISATDKTRTRPAGSFLFAGPPGVGKTFLVNNIVKVLGMQDEYKPFDMSEYADSQSYMDLLGFGDNYKNPQEGLLTGFVKKNPKCILLFDEIEKAHMTTIHLFLQILDEGVLTDNKTKERVSFKDALIFFTTNAGKVLYNAPDAFDFSGTPRKVILKALQRDINPFTQQPYFPAALCSRFAAGNVVMFNHMSASGLCKIAETEIRKQAGLFETEYKIKVDFDKNVFTALMFAEGGNADARSLRGRSERFFDDEIFELFRFMASEEHNGSISELESIQFNVELPTNEDVASLFRNTLEHNVLLFSSDFIIEKCKYACPGINVIGVNDIESTKKVLGRKSIGFAVVDLFFGTQCEKRFINIEDVDSVSRDVFWYIREKYADIPVYILQHDDGFLSKEEKRSFLREGVRGFLTLEDDTTSFSDQVARISEEMYQQASMTKLASSNSLVRFESGQRICNSGRTAEITLFDFELTTAVDAEDTQDVMSNVSRPNVKFEDIIGAENAKEELKFFIEYLKDPRSFVESGLRTPRGVLLYGPPGTGKTMLAKAVASEAGVTFISVEGNRFIKKYVGQGKDDLHEVFSVARKYAPSIIFIDEFEAIAKERRGGEHSAANGEDVLTALLTEMDGFHTDISRPVFVLAATNFDVTPGSNRSLDPALLRRFDSKICVDLPTKEERIRFINMKRAGSKAFDISDEQVENIALRSTGMSLADLDSIMELSLRTAIRNADKKVTDQVLDESFEIFNGGEKKAWEPSQLERTARHEAGHAFLCWHSGETPSYVTVVARGDHGGYMLHGGAEDKHVFTKDELLARIRISLGGRAAELVYYGDKEGVSTGAGGDLANATQLAMQIVCAYGMDEEFGLAVIDQKAAREGEISISVRETVNQILAAEMKNALRIIEENRPSIDAIVERLLSENHLTADEINSIFEEADKHTTC